MFNRIYNTGEKLKDAVNKERAWFAAYRSNDASEMIEALNELFDPENTTPYERYDLLNQLYNHHHLDDKDYVQLLDAHEWYCKDGNFYRSFIVRTLSGHKLSD